MITRIYRVRIKPELRAEFEPLFKTVAHVSVAGCKGCTNVVIGGPTDSSPDDYAMISIWRDADSLTAFAGADWAQPHIPDGMVKFVAKCWVDHFTHI